MKTCKNLKSLDLNGNNFNDEGMVVLANALKGNQKLSTLELGYNPMGEKGVKALVEIAKYDLPVCCSGHSVAGPLPDSSLGEGIKSRFPVFYRPSKP